MLEIASGYDHQKCQQNQHPAAEKVCVDPGPSEGLVQTSLAFLKSIKHFCWDIFLGHK